MRHEVNNHLALVTAALELIRFRPELRDKMIETVGQQCPNITAAMAKFSQDFTRTLNLPPE